MDLQKIFIENESLVAELMEKINTAIEEAGFNAEVDRNGRISYLDRYSYENQEALHDSYADILREGDRVLYGYYVKCVVIRINNVEKYVIDDEFATYWGIPSVAYGLTH